MIFHYAESVSRSEGWTCDFAMTKCQKPGSDYSDWEHGDQTWDFWVTFFETDQSVTPGHSLSQTIQHFRVVVFHAFRFGMVLIGKMIRFLLLC